MITSLPRRVVGVEITDEVIADFDNPDTDGVCWRVDREAFVFNENYTGWYTKEGYWGEKGAGIYAHESTEGTDEHRKLIQSQGYTPKTTTLRVSEAKYFEPDSEAVLNFPLTLDDQVLNIYEQAVSKWRKLSLLHNPSELRKENDQIDTPAPDIRRVNLSYFDTIAAYLSEIRSLDESTRPVENFDFFRRIGRMIPLEAQLAENDIDTIHARKELFGGSFWMAEEMEIFPLFLQGLGYDGMTYMFNGARPVSVTWSMDVIGTQQAWEARLAST